jgi:hypothetical protein
MGKIHILMLPVLFALGCGDLLDEAPLGIKQARCDLRPDRPQCTDIRNFKGPSLVTFEGVCSTLKAATMSGTYEEGAICDLTEAWGGCQSSSIDGSKQTNWYYKGGTKYPDEASARAECEGARPGCRPRIEIRGPCHHELPGPDGSIGWSRGIHLPAS